MVHVRGWSGGALVAFSLLCACGGDEASSAVSPVASGGAAGASGGTAGASGGAAGASGGTAGASGGAAGASGGTAGASGGTAGASGGTAGASGGTAGASGGTAGASAGTAGASGGTAGASGGAGGAVDHCAYNACGVCKAQHCNVVDNQCNGDKACEDAQQHWKDCICYHAGDAVELAKCDAALLAVNASAAQPIVDCVHTSCPECTKPGDDSPPAACAIKGTDCQLCSLFLCRQEAFDCAKSNPACGAASSLWRECACGAQQGTGTVSGCTSTFVTAGGAEATALTSCLASKCAAECGVP